MPEEVLDNCKTGLVVGESPKEERICLGKSNIKRVLNSQVNNENTIFMSGRCVYLYFF